MSGECLSGYCRSQIACGGFGYCRDKNKDDVVTTRGLIEERRKRMTNKSWPGAIGYPIDHEQDGWHLLKGLDGLSPVYWNAGERVWHHPNGLVAPEILGQHVAYHAPATSGTSAEAV